MLEPKEANGDIERKKEMVPCTWQKGLRRCEKGSWDGEIILGYLGGPSEITSILIRGRQEGQRQGQKQRLE